ncbi:MAG: TraV family lipoprotein [Thermodesulfovibrio sp.]|nr:TraV family lipoprotein [Thermodesulfovibrio sp.]
MNGLKSLRYFLSILGFVSLVGCASIMNPYHEDFTCPVMESGKCVPIQQAYQESLSKGHILSLDDKGNRKDVSQPEFSPLEDVYKDALFLKLSQLLKDPKTPILAPPKIVRIMILPYQDATGKEFYSARYVYTIVDEPQWILQNIKSLPVEESN